MPGFEVIGKEEQAAVNELFNRNGGILFAHGFDAQRKGIYRVREFEVAFADKFGVMRAQAVSSGSAAIKVALKALEIQPGDEVITQAHTFVATAEAILEVGARPVIANIDRTLNMDPTDLEKRITDKTRAIIPVHMMGAAVQMDKIMDIAVRYGLKVIEDTAQSIGATYRDRLLGTIGHIGIFSFDFGKTMTTGEGGMLVTNDLKTYQLARAYHDHGHEYNSALPRGFDTRQIHGFNYRMTEIQAAIGLVQLGKLEGIIRNTRLNKKKLKERLQDLELTQRVLVDEEGDGGDTFVFFLKNKTQVDKVVASLRADGVGTKNLPDALPWHFAGTWSHMPEFETWKSHVRLSGDILDCAVALAIMVKMTDDDIANTATAVRNAIKKL